MPGSYLANSERAAWRQAPSRLAIPKFHISGGHLEHVDRSQLRQLTELSRIGDEAANLAHLQQVAVLAAIKQAGVNDSLKMIAFASFHEFM
jgi:hypothetical protein